MRVPFNYLDRQFANLDLYLEDLREFVKTGDFTLGRPLRQFEEQFAAYCGVKEAIGVGSGTDALMLALKAIGIRPGDEVITTPMTFIATVGAIVMAGATPVFVDSEEGFVIDPSKIEAAITSKTRAILPVHYTGNMADMPAICALAHQYGLAVVEDACQAIGASIQGRRAGSWGDAAGFSFHPLKNLNVWADAGMVVTKSIELAERLRLLRNHGLATRDDVQIFGHNSRFDTLQAVVANRLMPDTEWITQRRQEIAARYDEAFRDLGEIIRVPQRRSEVSHVFHLYMLRSSRRDSVMRALQSRGIEAKIHYPVPVHLQPAAAHLGYKPGDFPVCERDCDQVLTLPSHQHLTDEEIDYTIEEVRKCAAGFSCLVEAS